uniref:Uncharacterized protein n=1 Tax=Panagrolaimus sp. ES5 TaxID=591445 RepID=A0AC34FV30_9BILA
MVKSSALGYAFIGLTSVATLIALIALFTPSWRSSGDYGLGAGGVGVNPNFGAAGGVVGGGFDNDYGTKFGLITYSCGSYANSFAYQSCYAQWRARSEWFIVLLMIIAIIAQIASLLSACIIPQATPKYYFATPILSAIGTTFLLMAIVIYAIKSNVNYLGSSNGINGIGGGVINPAIGLNGGLGTSDYYYHYGYSFWLAILSFILMVVATIIGFLASKIYRDEAIRYYNGRPNPAAATY